MLQLRFLLVDPLHRQPLRLPGGLRLRVLAQLLPAGTRDRWHRSPTQGGDTHTHPPRALSLCCAVRSPPTPQGEAGPGRTLRGDDRDSCSSMAAAAGRDAGGGRDGTRRDETDRAGQTLAAGCGTQSPLSAASQPFKPPPDPPKPLRQSQRAGRGGSRQSAPPLSSEEAGRPPGS